MGENWMKGKRTLLQRKRILPGGITSYVYVLAWARLTGQYPGEFEITEIDVDLAVRIGMGLRDTLDHNLTQQLANIVLGNSEQRGGYLPVDGDDLNCSPSARLAAPQNTIMSTLKEEPPGVRNDD